MRSGKDALEVKLLRAPSGHRLVTMETRRLPLMSPFCRWTTTYHPHAIFLQEKKVFVCVRACRNSFFNTISLKRYTFLQVLLLILSLSFIYHPSVPAATPNKLHIVQFVLLFFAHLKYCVQVNHLNEPKPLCFDKHSPLTCYFLKSLVLLSIRSAVLFYRPKMTTIKLTLISNKNYHSKTSFLTVPVSPY